VDHFVLQEASMTTLEERRAHRLLFLNGLYEETQGNSHSIVSMWGLGTKLGLDRDDFRSAVDFLKGQAFLEYKTLIAKHCKRLSLRCETRYKLKSCRPLFGTKSNPIWLR
jgi:hypothetical protein